MKRDISCTVCCKPVKSNQRGIFCDYCNRWTHAKCILLTDVELQQLSCCDEPWLCTSCLQSIFPFNHISNDYEFLMEASNDIDYQSLNFNPYLYDDSRFLLNSEDLDPDINYYNNIPFVDSYYKLPSEITCQVNDKAHLNFSIFHANCRGFVHNFDNLTSVITSLSIDVSVVAVTETWTNLNNENDYRIYGFNSEIKSRQHKQCGGVGLFINTSLTYKLRADLCIDVPDVIESIFIETVSDKMVVGCVYRPPGADVAVFTAYVDTILSRINKERKKCYIAGDYNIDLLKYDTHIPTSDYINCIFSHHFYPTVNKPTRITATSATLIDNIITNVCQTQFISSILYADISDHLPIIIQTDSKLKKNNFNKIQYRRFFRETSKNKFIKSIRSVNWDDITADTADTGYTKFHDVFCDIYESSFPLSKVNVTRKKNPRKPWMTAGLVRSCIKKEKLYKCQIRSPTDNNISAYKNFRNRLNKLIRIAQKNYYAEKFEAYKHNSRQTWHTIKQIINKNDTVPITDSFRNGNEELTDKYAIVEKFNEYFVNVGPTLANKIPIVPDTCTKYLSGTYKNSFYLDPTSADEITRVVMLMQPKTSAGYDNISVETIKSVITYIAEPLSKIINKSFSTGLVPDQLKIAKVCPIFKNGDRSQFSNYRPISVLPTFSKIVEKLTCNRLVSYLSKHTILCCNQFGFRSNHDTSMAVIDMVDKISSAMDSNQFSIGVFVDLSKAFDTLNHKILLAKLNHYGIRGIALDWFKSYLSNRYQYVEYNGVKSNLCRITCGVPQGSVLGPVLFLLYINDIVNASKSLELILFADDTNLFMSDANLDRLIATVNSDLVCLANWFAVNRLSLNVNKTNFVLFSNARKLYDKSRIVVKFNGTSLIQVQCAKFLGVYIDEHLSWDKHIQQVAAKVSRNVGILQKLRFSIPQSCLMMLYNSLIFPYLHYCCIVWGCVSMNKLNPLILLQKKCVRIIANTGPRTHSAILFKKFSMLKVNEICIFQTALFMFKFTKGYLPRTFSRPSYFICASSSHHYSTRSSQSGYLIPSVKTTVRQRNIRYRGPVTWNKLPAEIQKSTSLFSFKILLGKYLIDSY